MKKEQQIDESVLGTVSGGRGGKGRGGRRMRGSGRRDVAGGRTGGDSGGDSNGIASAFPQILSFLQSIIYGGRQQQLAQNTGETEGDDNAEA